MQYAILFLVLNSVVVLNFGLKAKSKKDAEVKNKESVNLLLQSYNKESKVQKCEKFCKLEKR